MIDLHIKKIARELELQEHQVRATAELLESEATVPFIARYRKEATGSLDEVAVTSIRDRLAQLEELDQRRESILKSLDERGLLTDELAEKIAAAETMTVLEDVYLPYRPKRRTRAVIAREKGLEPLATLIFAQDPETDPRAEAAAFVDAEKQVESVEDALAGTRDIIAEWINEDGEARAEIRALFEREGEYQCRVVSGREEDGAKFRDYFDWTEPVRSAPSHRVLAMRRGETEGVLLLRVRPPEERALALLEARFVLGDNPASQEVATASADSYRRLLSLSMETEIRLASKQKADTEAITVFADNLRQLLLAPPLGQKNILAIDPGFRTGCKMACLDPQGRLLETDTIYVIGSEGAQNAAGGKIIELCTKYGADAVAVGNGTAGRETEALVRNLDIPGRPDVVMVDESGASVYSASEAARAEFPDLDLTFRGAVSIGRRLQDPLAELVKIDPKSIGVGQYQHDVNQTELKKGLHDVVTSCVNSVGVELNTASLELLSYVSGLGPSLVKNILAYRNENGPFTSRQELLKVPRLGPKAFEQAAGFLRIRGGSHPLDASAVHPESYGVVEAMASDLECSLGDLLAQEPLRNRIQPVRYVTDQVGLPTLTDILAELAKPGRDPRESFVVFKFAEEVSEMEDLKPGMRLPGLVTNVTAFGAFVDVGVHQDGLVHISQMADRFIKDPGEVVKVRQQVMVTVLDVDFDRKRISLSLKEGSGGPAKPPDSDARPPARKKPERGRRDNRPAPFNNPFAKAFKK